ncbi:non-ribosomal peptide synthetase [Streptomyces californicus]|uniref:non-ribosomal peptide synthetase n=1 Tax=Streptomyces californicus TaxID=67351 RepID=UPI0037BDC13F
MSRRSEASGGTAGCPVPDSPDRSRHRSLDSLSAGRTRTVCAFGRHGRANRAAWPGTTPLCGGPPLRGLRGKSSFTTGPTGTTSCHRGGPHRARLSFGGGAELNVSEFFESVVARSSSAPAVIFGESVVDYAELNERANRLARRLMARGVGPDTLVAVAVPRSTRLIVAVLAVLKAGGAYLPLDPAYPADRLRHMVVDARPVLLLRTGSVSPLGLDVRELVLDDPSFEAEVLRERSDDVTQDERPAPLLPAHLMYVIYTSGSTGVPKGVAVPHTGVADLITTQARLYGVGAGDRVLQWASFSFDAWFWDFTLALMHGAALVMAEQHELLPGDSLRETMLRNRVNHAVLPPVALGMTDSEGLLVDGTITSTGDVCTRALAEEWCKGRSLYNAYGPTEVTVGASIGGPIEGVQDEVTVGTPWDGGAVHVLDRNLRELRDGGEGELFLSGSGVARGYLNRPSLTASRFVADPFGPPGSRMYRSGDSGRLGPDGALYFTGRVDHQVKVRGFRIELGEIEARLEAHPAVEIAVAAVGGEDASTEHIVAYVKTSARHGVSAAELREHTRRALPEHMVPSAIEMPDRFPTLLNGKLDRGALAERARRSTAARAASTAAGSASPAARGTETPRSGEETVLDLVRQTLGIAEAGPGDNFFELGGHSVLAAKLAGRIRREIGVSIPMRSLFEAADLREIARLVDGSAAAAVDGSTAPAGPS